MSAAKKRGTAAESAVVAYLRSRFWPHAERRALAGSKDLGDVAGVYGIAGMAVIEVKDCKAITLASWLDEALVEQANAGAEVGAVWAKRKGKGDPADWYVVMTGRQFTDLLKDGGYA